MTSKVTYLGALRTQCEHLKSGNTFITDAPTDNNGKGEAFSPTDTVATALASCMLTVMGIKADQLKIPLKRASAEVTKVMASDPRRISEIQLKITMPEGISSKNQQILERTAHNCPVLHSLHTDIELDIQFNWG